MNRTLVTLLWAVLALPALAQPPHYEVLASGLASPWALAFVGEGRMLVTERPGTLRLIEPGGKPAASVAGLPAVAATGQGGLLDLITDSAFARNRRIYFCFSEPGPGGTSSTALASARLSADARQLQDLKVIFSQKPKVSSRLHFGCRVVEGRDGSLFLTVGDRFTRMQDAQTLDNHIGKVLRVHKDGSVPADNPFVGLPGAVPEIWSYGHRNGQGATLGPDGQLWTHEHGPQGGDELNLPQKGKNYGWPVITYGENYGGGAIGEGVTQRAGMEQPLHYWVPSIAPSGMAFLSSERCGPSWRGDLFIGSLKFRYLARLELQGAKVLREHRLLESLGERIRDVRQGPDGYLYLLTDSPQGQLLRLMP